MNKEIYKTITSRFPLKERDAEQVRKLKFTFPKSHDKYDIINWLLERQFIDNYCIQLAGDDDASIDDVIQDIYLQLLEKPQDDWDKLTAQGFSVILSYVSGVIYREIKSKNSRSYYKYRRYNQNRNELNDAIIKPIKSLDEDYEES